MKNTWKKLLALLLALSMCFGSALPIFAADDANFDDDGNRNYDDGYVDDELEQEEADDREAQLQDRSDEIFLWNKDQSLIVYVNKRKQYNTLVQKLMAFDIWENTGAEYVEKLTRGDFAQVIAKLYNFSINADTQSFADVPPEHEHYNDIEMIRALGVVRGDENGNFKPDEPIIYADAVAMLVRICGYEQYAQSLGAYPENYLLTARRCDIISNNPISYEMENTPSATKKPAAGEGEDAAEATADPEATAEPNPNQPKTLQADSYVTRWDLAQMLEYLLDAAVAGSRWYSDGMAMTMNTGDGEVTLLQQVRNIEKGTGVVTSVGKQYIDGGKEMGENYVMIDGLELEQSDAEVIRKLGYRVDFYYTIDDQNTKRLVFIEEKERYNKVTEIDGKDIVSVSGKQISYYKNENDKRTSSAVASADKAILNGFEPGSFDEEDLRGADYIKLIDNNNDGSNDVVFIDKYEIFVAKSYSEQTGKVYSYFDNAPIDVDFGDENTVVVDSAGNASEPNIIANQSVIAYGTNEDGTKKKFVVTNKKVSGMISETYDLNNYEGARIKIDDKEYRFSKNTEDIGKDLPKPGQSYTFLLDYKDRIAGIERNADSADQYGYLVSAVAGGVFETEVRLRVFSYVTAMTDYSVAEKVEFDGDRIKNSDVMKRLENVTNTLNNKMAALDEKYIKPDTIYDGDVLYIRQPIRYTIDENNVITRIDTPVSGEKEDVDKKDTFFGRSTMTMYDDFTARSEANGHRPGGLYLRNAGVMASDNNHYIGVNGKAKVMIVPVSNDFSVISDEDNYDRPGVGYFNHFGTYPESPRAGQTAYRMEVYNLNKEHTTDLIVYYTDLTTKTEFDNGTPLTVITDVVTALDEDGMPEVQLRGIQGALEIDIPLSDNLELTKKYRGPDGTEITSTIERGDIIRYETNFQGEMTRFTKIFDLDDQDDPNYVIAGNEVGSTINYENLSPTMIAVSDGKYAANGHQVSHIGSGRNEMADDPTQVYQGANYSFDAGFRLVYGSVMYNNGTNLVLKADLIDQATGEVKEDQTEICTATAYNFICIDEERDMIYVPTVDEIVSEYNTNEDEATKMILHTGGGKQRTLVMVKRKK